MTPNKNVFPSEGAHRPPSVHLHVVLLQFMEKFISKRGTKMIHLNSATSKNCLHI